MASTVVKEYPKLVIMPYLITVCMSILSLNSKSLVKLGSVVTNSKNINLVQQYTGLFISFQTLEMSYIIVHLRKNQMKKSIIHTLSENLNEIKQIWQQLQPQT